jgi:hypothetical protein
MMSVRCLLPKNLAGGDVRGNRPCPAQLSNTAFDSRSQVALQSLNRFPRLEATKQGIVSR